MKLTKTQLREIIKEEIQKLNENVYGISLKRLPDNVSRLMRSDWNWEQNKEYDAAIKGVKAWVAKNIKKFESGLSASEVSNKGRDLKKFATQLETNVDEIIELIDFKLDEELDDWYGR